MQEDGKPYTIEIENRGQYLHVKVGGQKVTPEIAMEYWCEIDKACEREQCSKILLEHNFVEMIGMTEMLQVIGPVGEVLKGRMLAFYDSHGNYDIPEAGKMILRSHDVMMQIFHNLADAERWLLAN